MFLAPLSIFLLRLYEPGQVLQVIGALITVACVVCVICFCVSAEYTDTSVTEENSAAEMLQTEYTAQQMMRTKGFYLLLLAMFLGLLPYFLVSPVSQSYQIAKHISENVAVSAVMFGSLMNALTRLILPRLSDKIGREQCIKGLFLFTILAMGGLTVSSGYGITVSIILLYGCYGGIMGSFPAMTSSLFGLKRAGENYGYVMFGIILATFAAPGLSSLLQTAGYTMQQVFFCGIIAAAGALICICLLGKAMKTK